jgi:hypothetical protein
MRSSVYGKFRHGQGGAFLATDWLELLKEIAPHMTREAVLRDPALAAGIGQFAAIQSMASSSAAELSAIDIRGLSFRARSGFKGSTGSLVRSRNSLLHSRNSPVQSRNMTDSRSRNGDSNSVATGTRTDCTHSARFGPA